MYRGRYQPLYDEIVGTLKIFVLIWLITFVFFFIILGATRWAMWAGVGFGLIIALIGTFFLSLITGVRNINLWNWKK